MPSTTTQVRRRNARRRSSLLHLCRRITACFWPAAAEPAPSLRTCFHSFAALEPRMMLSAVDNVAAGAAASLASSHAAIVAEIGDGSSIAGTTWHDIDGDGIREDSEPALAGQTVFLDTNNDGHLDWIDSVDAPNGTWDEGEGEQWTISGQDGAYVFDGLASDLYHVRQLAGPGYIAGSTTPNLNALDAALADHFGHAVAVSNGIALVGVPDSGVTGAAYLLNTTTGVQTARLVAPDAASLDDFGHSVAISGGIAIVGSPYDDDGGSDSGSVYLFDAETGAFLRKITAADAAAGDAFGISVALSNGVAIVGANGDDDAASDAGSAYLFDVETGELIGKITANDAATGDAFGSSVSISHGIAIIGAPHDDDGGSDSGSAYLYHAETGTLISKLTAFDAAADDGFGASVAVDDGIAIVGAEGDDDGGTDRGAAYLFDAQTGSLISKVSDPDGGILFGSSVAISEGVAIVGVRRDNVAGNFAGSAYLFDALTGAYIRNISAPDGENWDAFGTSVAISDGLAVVGAPFDDDGVNEAGSVYVFKVPSGDAIAYGSAVQAVVGAAVIVAPDAAAFDRFGVSAAISDGIAIVGATGADEAGTDTGTAYLLDVATGAHLATLTAPDAAVGDAFGHSVAIHDGIAVVGSYLANVEGVDSTLNDAGKAYLFDAVTGALISDLAAPDAAFNDRFGSAVAVSNGVAIVGAIRDDDGGMDSGSAYLFNTETGEYISKLTALDAAAGDEFGTSVSIGDGIAIVGAPWDGAGSAYLFDVATGMQVAKLTAPDAVAQGLEFFGSSVAISDGIAVVGARWGRVNGDTTGAAFLFDAETGEHISTITAPDAARGDNFGASVAISNDVAIVGADGDEGETGSAYLFDVETGTLISKITAPDADSRDQFGSSVAIGGGIALIGARGDDAGGTDSGKGYLFDVVTGQLIEGGTAVVDADLANYNPTPIATASATATPEDLAGGSTIGGIHALDFYGDTITWSITAGNDAERFSIDTATGVVSLATGQSLDFETAASHELTIRVTDSIGGTAEAVLTIDVTDVNEAPTITSAPDFSVPENATSAGTISANDPDAGAILTYSITGGADAAFFDLDAVIGVLTFKSAPDFEVPADADGDNVYDVQVQVSDGEFTDTQDVAVTLTEVNEAPTIASAGSFSLPENTTAAGTVTGSDPDAGAMLAFSIVGGADAPLFDIDAATGALTFKSTPDFELPTDDDGDNVYDVQVQVTDGEFTNTQDVAVTVTSVNEASPVLTSGTSFNLPENGTSVGTITATDADGDAVLTYSIAGGADAALFDIDAATGALIFNTAPDFELPADAGGDNVYDVQIQVSDGEFTDTQDLAVTVTDLLDIAFRAGSPAIYTDATGQQVILGLAGVGQGTASLEPGQDIEDLRIQLTGTNAGTTFAIVVLGVPPGSTTSLSSILIHGDIGVINAPGANLTGELTVDGYARAIALGDVTDSTLTLGGTAGQSTAIALQGLTDSSITAGSGIGTLIIRSGWTDTGAVADTLTAPWVWQMIVAEQMQASLDLSGVGAPRGYALGALTAGSIQGGHYDLEAGSIGNIIASGIASLTLDAATGVVGRIASRGTVSDLDAHTGSLGSLAIVGDLVASDIELDTAAGLALSQLVVTGSIEGSTITAATGIGSITASGIDGLSLDAAPGVIGRLLSRGDVTGLHLQTGLMNALGIVGNLTDSDIRLTTVRGTGIANLVVTGRIVGSTIESAGHVLAFQAGGMTDSRLFVGVTDAGKASADRLPAGLASSFIDSEPVLVDAVIRGSDNSGLLRSQIAASRIVRLAIVGEVAGDAGSSVSGAAADRIDLYVDYNPLTQVIRRGVNLLSQSDADTQLGALLNDGVALRIA